MVLAETETEKKTNKGSKLVNIELYYKNSETLKILREIQELPVVRIGRLIRVGSGNYEKDHNDGRYRKTCGTIKHITACNWEGISRSMLFSSTYKKLNKKRITEAL